MYKDSLVDLVTVHMKSEEVKVLWLQIMVDAAVEEEAEMKQINRWCQDVMRSYMIK